MNQAANYPWNRKTLKNPHLLQDKNRRVHAMFSSVSQTYDLLNHLLSLNMDRHWRNRAVDFSGISPGQSVLDVCCGTGDMALAYAQREPRLKKIIGVDFVEPMLEIARRKCQRFQEKNPTDTNHPLTYQWTCADAQKIPLESEQFDHISCAFGIRNLQNVQQGLNEMYRLLKSPGRAVILEFAMPTNPIIRWGYECYFRLILPAVATFISQDKTGAYHYLPRSVDQFNCQSIMTKALAQANFNPVHIESLSFGSVLIFVAEKP
ncbi:MAG: bifunctional demethylmenaquinone methyltransferase/2-methoxy-6-polyprenyl-1,4-benzoquinol methylase UbiE [Planctomycetes bacterium]|nr:bifunctional demethylmenaquinone methyltransferase/2-methoxy-6-polyprenyl-1,4-benzoquinol methylase UbiE [Planctomycetota bacterium]